MYHTKLGIFGDGYQILSSLKNHKKTTKQQWKQRDLLKETFLPRKTKNRVGGFPFVGS